MCSDPLATLFVLQAVPVHAVDSTRALANLAAEDLENADSVDGDDRQDNDTSSRKWNMSAGRPTKPYCRIKPGSSTRYGPFVAAETSAAFQNSISARPANILAWMLATRWRAISW
jgi:hypothetical protein